MRNKTSKSIERRRVLRGAAWATPVLATAIATPAAAASGGPICPTCIQPGALLGGATTSQSIVVGNKGALAFAGVFGMNSSNCNLSLFQPLYTSVVTSATLTMSDGSAHTGTGLGTATGTFGQLGALPGTWVFSGINFPSDTYLPNSNPVRPTRVTATVNMILVGLPSLLQITCPVTLAFLGGTGTLNYTGTATPVL